VASAPKATASAAKRWGGQIHGFLLQQGAIDGADLALREAAGHLRAAFD
jgi:hypothetical protein